MRTLGTDIICKKDFSTYGFKILVMINIYNSGLGSTDYASNFNPFEALSESGLDFS